MTGDSIHQLFARKEYYYLVYFIVIHGDSKSDCYCCIYAGCMAALDAEHYLQEIGSQEGKSDWVLKLIGSRSEWMLQTSRIGWKKEKLA